MTILEPDNLKTALTPTVYFNWVVGLGVFRRPRSKFLYVMMMLHSVVCWVFCIIAFWVGIHTMIISSFFNDNSPMAATMYKAIVYTNTAMALLTPILARMRHKGLDSVIDDMQRIDDTCANLLGVKKSYRITVLTQIYHILAITLIMVTIGVIDSSWYQSAMPFFENLAMVITFHHPILLMLVTDFTFCGATRCIGNKFKDLNAALLGLTDSADVALNPRGRLIVVDKKFTKASTINEINNVEPNNSIDKHHLFRTIRKSHLELSKITGRLNLVFGVQNLLSLAVSSVMITGLLYTIYSAFYWVHTMRERIREITPPACWCTIYIFKILLVTYCCATVSTEAQKSGQIIYEVLGSATDKEFNKDIQEFALQMIQNPVRFTACGFFTLDYTYVQGVIGSITTYLVILIQMSNPTASSTPVANVTTT